MSETDEDMVAQFEKDVALWAAKNHIAARRERIATACLQGLLAKKEHYHYVLTGEDSAPAMAVRLADALIKELDG